MKKSCIAVESACLSNFSLQTNICCQTIPSGISFIILVNTHYRKIGNIFQMLFSTESMVATTGILRKINCI